MGVIEVEQHLAGQLLAVQLGNGRFQHLHACGQSAAELLFFRQQRLLDTGLLANQLRIGLAHLFYQRPHQGGEERLVLAQLVAMTQGATDDAAQHVATAFIGRDHPVTDQEAGGTDMVGDHPQGFLFHILAAGGFCRGLQQRLKQVDLVVGMDPLQHRRDTLQAHTGIHAGLGQRLQLAILLAVVLHEHQVPDLNVAIQILALEPWWTAGHIRPVIVENFRAGTTGAGVTHLPEIIFVQAGETLGADAHFLQPDIRRFIIGHMHGDPEALFRQAQGAGEELPGELDSFALEVIAEAEVTQHLEEGVMPRRVTHVLQVVVLATSTHTALGAGGTGVIPGFTTQKHVLELVHPRVGEQQGGVVMGHQRGGWHLGVPLAGKVVQEGLA